jgi:hypothetical protein
MDKEGNDIFLYISGVPPIGSYIRLLGSEKMEVYATEWSQLGNYWINLTLSDTHRSKSYFFNVTIFNTPPYLPRGTKPAN